MVLIGVCVCCVPVHFITSTSLICKLLAGAFQALELPLFPVNDNATVKEAIWCIWWLVMQCISSAAGIFQNIEECVSVILKKAFALLLITKVQQSDFHILSNKMSWLFFVRFSCITCCNLTEIFFYNDACLVKFIQDCGTMWWGGHMLEQFKFIKETVCKSMQYLMQECWTFFRKSTNWYLDLWMQLGL